MPRCPSFPRACGASAPSTARASRCARSRSSDAAARGSIGRASFSASRTRRERAFVSFLPPEVVARLAARHYLAESASQIVRLVASNKLLGDPARLWAELGAATRELAASPPRVASATRFSRRVAAAVAAWAKTILRHAREVTSEMEERFEAAKRRRVERLRSRRIADDEAEDDDGSSRGSARRRSSPKPTRNERSAR